MVEEITYGSFPPPEGIDELHSPPDSFLTWVSVTDNITNKKVIKDKIACIDFKNTVLNRIFNKNLPNDVLSPVDMSRIYVTEDSRARINEHNCTTVSAIKCLDNETLIQYVHHSPYAYRGQHINEKFRTILYDYSKKGDSGYMKVTNRCYQEVETNKELVNHLKNGIWSWYFKK